MYRGQIPSAIGDFLADDAETGAIGEEGSEKTETAPFQGGRLLLQRVTHAWLCVAVPVPDHHDGSRHFAFAAPGIALIPRRGDRPTGKSLHLLGIAVNAILTHLCCPFPDVPDFPRTPATWRIS